MQVHVFKRTCGMSVCEYVIRLRIAHAQQLLSETELNVLEIAVESGFGSTAQSYEAFRRELGSAPREYRAARASHYIGRTREARGRHDQ